MGQVYLANKYVPCSVDRLRRRSAHAPGQEAAQQFDDTLHHTQVVEHGHHGAKKYYYG